MLHTFDFHQTVLAFHVLDTPLLPFSGMQLNSLYLVPITVSFRETPFS